MNKSDLGFVVKSFIIWRILIFLPIFLSKYFFELQKNFLGGGFLNYIKNPYFWSWANFDGEHYISIAKMGYGNGEQAFFPLYPYLIRLVSDLYGFKNPDLLIATGIFISNVAFFMALIGLFKLISLDYSKRIAKSAIIFLLVFPTSFYFAGVYTESLFLMLVVWSFYFFRQGNYLLAGLLGASSTASRVVGIVLMPIFLFSSYRYKLPLSRSIFSIMFVPLGLLGYMYYGFITWGNPLQFFTSAAGFGEQRSEHLIILPQVFYRYFVKIIPNLTWDYFPVIFTTLLELTTAIVFLAMIFFLFYHLIREKKLFRSDYWLYLTIGFLIPTLSGSFSSLPRYVLALFPAFIYFAMYSQKLNKYILLGIYLGLAIIAVIAQMLFVRGYFVS